MRVWDLCHHLQRHAFAVIFPCFPDDSDVCVSLWGIKLVMYAVGYKGIIEVPQKLGKIGKQVSAPCLDNWVWSLPLYTFDYIP